MQEKYDWDVTLDDEYFDKKKGGRSQKPPKSKFTIIMGILALICFSVMICCVIIFYGKRLKMEELKKDLTKAEQQMDEVSAQSSAKQNELDEIQRSINEIESAIKRYGF